MTWRSSWWGEHMKWGRSLRSEWVFALRSSEFKDAIISRQWNSLTGSVAWNAASLQRSFFSLCKLISPQAELDEKALCTITLLHYFFPFLRRKLTGQSTQSKDFFFPVHKLRCEFCSSVKAKVRGNKISQSLLKPLAAWPWASPLEGWKF